jgi:hypothetical protein
MVGGLVTSQLLTLFITPVIFLYLDQAQVWWRSRRAAAAHAPAPAISLRQPRPALPDKGHAAGDD